MQKIIGIHGFKGSGKDTVGKYLVENHGYELESFANPIKDMLSIIFGWDRAMLEGDTRESREWRETPDTWWEEKLSWQDSKHVGNHKRFTPRAAMQLIGTDALRNHFDQDIWLKSLEARIRGRDKIVITDCRFPNEVNLIKINSGLLFRVKRGPEPVWFNIAKSAIGGNHISAGIMANNYPDVHISEYSLLATESHVIENNGSIDELFGIVENIVGDHYKN